MNERKEAYLNKEYGGTNANAEACFKKAEQNENVLGKDLSEWITKEIIDFYKSFCTPSVDFLYNIHSVYRKYTAWCVSEDMVLDRINHYDELSLDTLLLCINKEMADRRIISREELLKVTESLDNPRDKFLCLACFEGFGGDKLSEIINVKLSDFKNGKVRLGKREIKYSSKLYEYAKEAAETYKYLFRTDNDGNDLYYEMTGGLDQVIKQVVSRGDCGVGVKPQALYTKLKKIQVEYDVPAFTSNALKESGRVHMIRELVTSGQKITDAIKATYDTYGSVASISAYITKFKAFLT